MNWIVNRLSLGFRTASWPGVCVLTIVPILALSGLFLNISASTAYSEYYFKIPFYLGIRQFVFLLLGASMMMVAMLIPLSFWHRYNLFFLLASVALLLLVFPEGTGKTVNASSRWIDLGWFSLQPAEVLKFSLPLFLASYLSRRELSSSWILLLPPFIVVGLINFLLLLQPDFGGLLILSFMALAILFLGGMRWRDLALVSLVGTGLFFLLTVIKPYRLDRLKCLTDENIWQFFFDECYQIGHSIIAIERGGLFGQGLGASVQKYLYLPEAYTDFIFSIMAEELGFLICLVLLGLFSFVCVCLLISGGFRINRGQQFTGYLLCGISILWMTQILINVGVSVGYFPITGMSLPFFGYGGSALVMNMFIAGIAVNCLMEKSIQPEKKPAQDFL